MESIKIEIGVAVTEEISLIVRRKIWESGKAQKRVSFCVEERTNESKRESAALGDGRKRETASRQEETTKKRRPTMGRLSKVVIPTLAAPFQRRGPSIKPSDLASPWRAYGEKQGGGARISKIKGSTMDGNQWLVFG